MSRFDPEVRKVGQRLGRLEAAPMADVPNLPNLPNLCWVARPLGVCIYTRAQPRKSFQVRKVRKVRNMAVFIGLQGSQPWLDVRKVGKLFEREGENAQQKT